jgi:DNA-binding CsgD family transcriptional regulator
LAEKLIQKDLEDVLKVGGLCMSCVKAGKMDVKHILAELCKIFQSSNVEFFPPNQALDGVDLPKVIDLNDDRWSIDKYAEYYWRYDPLFSTQFCLTPTNLVFKTDDIIPYNQLKNLTYYQDYLSQINWFSELVIRLCNEEGFFGTISVSRPPEQPCFDTKDVQKAQLLLPFLIDSFESANYISRIDEVRKILEQWAEYQHEGMICLNSEFRLLYYNESAWHFCRIISEGETGLTSSKQYALFTLPSQLREDCRNLLQNSRTQNEINTTNRIITTKYGKRYYIRYLLVNKGAQQSSLLNIIIRLNELLSSDETSEVIFVKGSMFSQREQTILQYAAAGLTNKEIGKLLFISPFTVQSHLQHIFEKTGFKNRTQLANIANQL